MQFDIAMPLTLFAVTFTAVMLSEKSEGKLKKSLEERKFGTKDTVLLVAAISITVSLIVFVPQTAVMTLFLFSYSMLLFLFTYIFSDTSKSKAKTFFLIFFTICLIAAITSLFKFGTNIMVAYGGLALACISSFAYIAFLYENVRRSTKERFYMALLPPALFLCLYLFFSGTPVWFPYLINAYGVIFAVLVIIYIGSVFTWKTTLIFVGLLTIMDIILVLFTGTMVSAARHVSSLRLPILVTIPIIPTIMIDGSMLYMSLGLGDFFFAGIIGIQTAKKFGRKTMFWSIVAMCLSFFAFETFLLNAELRAFPGTLMIVCGWIPIVIWKSIKSGENTPKGLTEQCS
jgi:presenilin-like A22 family membrane protease